MVYEGWSNTEVSNGMSVPAARRADAAGSRGPAHREFLLVAFAFIALLGAELVLVTTIPGTNYDGADGKAAQAEILTTLEFAKVFDITNLNPLQGLWPQMMPMNVWVNPAYWPFAFFNKELAAIVISLRAYSRTPSDIARRIAAKKSIWLIHNFKNRFCFWWCWPLLGLSAAPLIQQQVQRYPISTSLPVNSRKIEQRASAAGSSIRRSAWAFKYRLTIP